MQTKRIFIAYAAAKVQVH